MKLIITGSPKKVSKEDCREAIFWFAEKLMSPRVVSSLHIDVKFIGGLFKKEGNIGQTCPVSSETPPRDFEIPIEDSLGFKRTLRTLAHELVHVKQYALGELHDYVRRDPFCRWHDEVIDANGVDYWEQPWEIEAYGRDVGLYERYMAERRAGQRKSK